jgi:DNA-binding TFAR19-related protein (PDSD5 family)
MQGRSGSSAWSRRSNDAVTVDNQTDEMGVATQETLVIRAWLEPGAKPRLRVRLVRVIPGEAERQVLSTTSAEEASEAVRNWLTGLTREKGSSAS